MKAQSDAQSDPPAQVQRQGSSSGLCATALNIFASPAEAFARIEARPSILFPLLLTLIPTLLITFWYFQVVDYQWFIDDTLSRFGDMSAEQMEAMRSAYASQSRATGLISGLLGSVFSVLIIYTLHAGYLTLVSSMSGDRFRFRHWFSLISWTHLPTLLVALVMAVNIALSSNGQISLYDANALSLASLGLSSNSTAIQSMYEAFSLPMLWALALLVAGYRQWLHCGWLRAALLVLAPYLLIVGIVLFFALG